MDLQTFFQKAWNHYVAITPLAQKIKSLLEARGETLVNDHIAYRTFNHPKIGMYKLKEFFLANGYKEVGSYQFPVKKLQAIHLEHPQNLPKIFISEINYQQLSQEALQCCAALLQQLPATLKHEQLLLGGRLWEISYQDYHMLAKESEYVAWLSAIGMVPNHFTVSVNHLKTFSHLQELNQFLKGQGLQLNQSGGEIKGGPAQFLEQSSTVADRQKVTFSEGDYNIPTCYYEFALRYKQKNGRLFHGFIESSADKIFESTYEKNI